MAAAVNTQVLAPVIRDPNEFNVFASLEVTDTVRPAAQRWLQRSLSDIALPPVMLRQHGGLAQQRRILLRLTGWRKRTSISFSPRMITASST